MEKDLIKFYENISYVNKDMAKYEDEKGNIFIIPVGQLICNCGYNELDKNEYTMATFNGIVDKSIEYEEIKIKRPVSKEEVTKNKEDKYILTDKEVIVKRVWVVQNALKISKSFNNQKEAIELTNKINSEVFKKAEVI